MTQAGDDGSLCQGGSKGGGKKCSDSGCVLKVELEGFAER